MNTQTIQFIHAVKKILPHVSKYYDEEVAKIEDMIDALEAHAEKTIEISWHIEDVKEVAPDLTDEQALDVLYSAKEDHDACIGINWDVLSFHADQHNA